MCVCVCETVCVYMIIEWLVNGMWYKLSGGKDDPCLKKLFQGIN